MATTARLTILWDTPGQPEQFERHYRDVHIPLAKKIPGLRRYTLSRGLEAVRGGEPYYLIAELDFDDLAALRAGLASPEGRATAADVPILSADATLRSMIYELEDV